MDQELSKQLFLSARDGYERAARWSIAAVAALAVFHVLIFTRYVQTSARLDAARAQEGRLSAKLAAVESLGDDLAAFTSAYGFALAGGLDRQLAELRASMVEFGEIVRALRSGSGPVEVPHDPFGRATIQAPLDIAQVPNMSDVPNMAAQLPPRAADLEPRLSRIILTTDVRRAIASSDGSTISSIVTEIVEGTILPPHFEALNAHWSTQVVPDLTARATAAADQADALTMLMPEEAAAWADLSARLRDATGALAQTRFSPPKDQTWWHTVEGKMSTFEGIRTDALDGFTRRLGDTDRITAIEQAAAAALERQQALRADCETTLANLQATTEKQAKSLASLGKPFELIATDLDFVVRFFPLALGLLLAAIAAWKGQRLHELALAARLAVDQGHGMVARRWVGFIDPAIARAHSISAAMARPAALRAILGCAWVVLAAVQLHAWPGAIADHAALYPALGMLAVLLGEGYRYLHTRRAAAALAGPTGDA